MKWPLIRRWKHNEFVLCMRQITAAWRAEADSHLANLVEVRDVNRRLVEERDHWKKDCMDTQLKLNELEDNQQSDRKYKCHICGGAREFFQDRCEQCRKEGRR